jgi:DNA-directed RNA polymerase subunit K/omega
MTEETLSADVIDEQDVPAEDLPPAPPVTDRFLFVDIAALRAKQLRRGATPRLRPDAGSRPDAPTKAERIAMEEVRQRLVQYELPTFKPRSAGSQA